MAMSPWKAGSSEPSTSVPLRMTISAVMAMAAGCLM